VSEHRGGERPGDDQPGGGTERLIAERYRLLSRLGEGGMGTVWRARDELLHREVAVKEVRAPVGLPTAERERLYARLEREAWAAARVSHRNVVTVYDVATEDQRPWIVMELVRGLSLADVLEAEGPMEPARAARIGAEVLAALRAAHEAGVLHRDVKPGNVLLSNDGRVVLTDFGIATVEGSAALTMTGEMIGSPEFVAPERALGRNPGPESDLWSLGVLLYAAVEGASPFRQDTPLSTLRAVVDEELPPPRRAGPLTPVIEGLLRKDPALRTPAERAEQDLRLIAAGGSPGSPGPTTVAVHPYTPTVASPPTGPGRGTSTSREPAGPAPWERPASRTESGSPAEDPGRNRRNALVLAAGLALLLLALAGLTYALIGRDDSGGNAGTNSGTSNTRASETAGGTAGRTTTSTGPTEPSYTSGGATDDKGEPSSPTAGESGPSGGNPPPQSVGVTLSGWNTHYSGSCPPPTEQAARITATFTVGRLPAEVRYRWVAEGAGDGGSYGWRTLTFPAGGERTRQDTKVLGTDVASGTYEADVHVEVADPVDATSNSVPVSVTCTKAETPTYGASPSASP
jgi:eukaryotic-like serine/threonine-protein kinase